MSLSQCRPPSGLKLSAARVSELKSKFAATLVVYSLHSSRKVKCTLSSLQKQAQSVIAEVSHSRISLADLRDFQWVYPGLLQLAPIPRATDWSAASLLADDSSDYELRLNAVIVASTIGRQASFFEAHIKRKAAEAQSAIGEHKRVASRRAAQRTAVSSTDFRNVQSQTGSASKRAFTESQATDSVETQLRTQSSVGSAVKRRKTGDSKRRKAAKRNLSKVDFNCANFGEKCREFSFFVEGSVVNTIVIPAKAPRFASLLSAQSPESGKWSIAPELVAALRKAKGISVEKLYTHQCKAIGAVMQGRHCVIATATASGKSLCYTLPIVSRIVRHLTCAQPSLGSALRSRVPRALLLFPTKALAQCQLRSLRELIAALRTEECLGGMAALSCDTFDGDTPRAKREDILKNSAVILTNPDTIHLTLVPRHSKCPRLFEDLRYVVLDECHCYDGIFGTHVSHVIRRLRRVCKAYGNTQLQFVGSSATIGNPKAHFADLVAVCEERVVCVDAADDGSAKGRKQIVFWRPPLLEKFRKLSHSNGSEVGGKPKADSSMVGSMLASRIKTRRSHLFEASQLFTQFVMAGLRCIAFCPTRSVCELVFRYYLDSVKTADGLDELSANALRHLVSSYRGGYSTESRRRIEEGLFGGSLRAVTATKALELGVDIGGMDATVHIGFPGLASLCQQFGRAGRGDQHSHSCAVFVAADTPVDLYLLARPSLVTAEKHEAVVVSPTNKYVLCDHILCAVADMGATTDTLVEAFALGTESAKRSGVSPELVREMVERLCGERLIERETRHGLWVLTGHCKAIIAEATAVCVPVAGSALHPSRIVGIRNICSKVYTVRVGDGKVIDSLPQHNAFLQIHEGAILLHMASEYRVQSLDLKRRVAIVQKVAVNYYTSVRHRTDFSELKAAKVALSGSLHFGVATVRTVVFGYYRVLKKGHAVIDSLPLKLPHIRVRSHALWLSIPESIVRLFAVRRLDLTASIHSAAHSLISLFSLRIKCSAEAELRTECPQPNDSLKRMPRLIVAERIPHGVGLVEEAFAGGHLLELMRMAVARIQGCDCESRFQMDGCLSCVHSLKCAELNTLSTRSGALLLLKELLSFFG